MYELRRALLRSIGPADARYENVQLDFTDHHDRPSLATVLHLENGGGKSVVLKLLFSALLSERRHTVGEQTLSDFVLSKDVGHIVLEWVHVLDGTRLITGKLTEWHGRHVSADSSKLQECWY